MAVGSCSSSRRFIVGLTCNHLLCDGSGLLQFFQAVGELAHGLTSPSIIPVRGDSLELGLPPFSTDFMRFVATLQPSTSNVTVPSSLINHIKHMCLTSQGQPCSVFEAVAVVLWRCRMRAILSDQGALVALFSILFLEHTPRPSGMVANGNIIDLVKMIQHAKDQVSDQPNMDVLQQRLLGIIFLVCHPGETSA
ncbi:hypothetical protein ACQ4PT_066071 [Festuca glaucescens]